MPAPPALLLVHDNPELLTLLKAELSGSHRVRVATGPEEAWTQLQNGPPDLLVCDAQIPGTGRRLCCRVRRAEEVPSIPIILLGRPADTDVDPDPADPDETDPDGTDPDGTDPDGTDPDGTDPGSANPYAAEDDVVDAPTAESVADAVVEKPFTVGELRECLGRYLPAWEPPAWAGAKSVFLREVVQVIERRLHDPDFSVAAFAEAMDMSRRHLARRLRAEADTTPTALIRARRLERAKTQLQENPDTVREVGQAVGFRSASHFSTVFRKAVGMPPSAYREQHAERDRPA